MSTVADADVETPSVTMPTFVDLRAWDAVVSRRGDSYELVEGVPTMAPGESFINRGAATLLAGLLNADRGDWVAVTDMDVTLRDGPAPTVRRPDVVVARRRRGESLPPARLLADEVLFVAEVVAPSSVERDLVTKRREYSEAGIPAYLVVDLRAEPGALTLYEQVEADGGYVASPSGSTVTVIVAGRRIDIAVDDLLT